MTTLYKQLKGAKGKEGKELFKEVRGICEERLKIESEWRKYSKGNGKARRDYLEVHLRMQSVVMVSPIFDTNVQ